MTRYFDRKTQQWVAGHPPAFIPPTEPRGPGTELKRLLESFGITAGPNCACRAMMLRMDLHGPAWCEGHIDEIVAVMVKEAKRRDWMRLLPGKVFAAEALVRRAIARSL